MKSNYAIKDAILNVPDKWALILFFYFSALALGHIFELIRETNRVLHSKPSGPKAKELVSKAKDLLQQVRGVLNIFNKRPEEWYDSLMKTEISLSQRRIYSTRLRKDRRPGKRKNGQLPMPPGKNLKDAG